MERFITDFAVDYFKTKTSKAKPITNQELDFLLQKELGIRSLSDSGIRALIHHIRVNVPIRNEDDEQGWICASADGYYLSYNGVDILTHLQSVNGKINKMSMMLMRGKSVLDEKIYFKQSKLEF